MDTDDVVDDDDDDDDDAHDDDDDDDAGGGDDEYADGGGGDDDNADAHMHTCTHARTHISVQFWLNVSAARPRGRSAASVPLGAGREEGNGWHQNLSHRPRGCEACWMAEVFLESGNFPSVPYAGKFRSSPLLIATRGRTIKGSIMGRTIQLSEPFGRGMGAHN